MFTKVVRRFRVLTEPAACWMGAEGGVGQEIDEGRIAAGGGEMDGRFWGPRRLRRSSSISKLLRIASVNSW